MSLENKEQELLTSKMKGNQIKRTGSIGRKILIGLGAVGLFILLVFVAGFLVKIMKRQNNKAKYKDAEYVKQDTLNYLEERYGEEFEIESVRGMSYAYDYINMYAYPKGLQDEAHKFKIQGRFNKEGNLEYCDSYVMVKLTDDYEAYVDEIIDEYFDDYKFYLEFDSEWITSNLPPDTTVEDLFQLRANVDYPLPDLAIFMQSSQKENFTDENIMAMCRKFAKWGYRGTIHIICYDDNRYYEEKNNENKRQCRDGERLHRKSHSIFIRDNENIDYD